MKSSPRARRVPRRAAAPPTTSAASGGASPRLSVSTAATVHSEPGVAGAPSARQAAASRLALVTARVLAESRPDLVAVTGGETAVALLRAVGATRVELSGAPSSGLALGEAVVDAGSTFPLLTKAGGFGPPDLFLALLKGTP